MLNATRATEAKDVGLRMLVDFVLIHLCMIGALAGAVTSYMVAGEGAASQAIAASFPRYYWRFFWPLSLLFPVVFLLSGFYRPAAGGGHKPATILGGAAFAALLFLAVHHLVFREEVISQSVAIWFSALATLALASGRLAKALALRHSQNWPQRIPWRAGNSETVLVVGGAGYIGSILVRQLLDTGRKVRVLDSLVYGSAPLRDIMGHPNFQLLVGDCRNIQSVVGAVKGADAIVHLAAIVGDPACEQDRQTALEINYSATRMLIEVAKGYRIRNFVFASSCSVYGATDTVVDEESPVRPLSCYAQTKTDSEQALLQARTESFHPTILRLATVFGYSYRPRFDLVVNLLTAKAHQEGVITIYNGKQWRPFIHVRDIAEAVLCVLDAPIKVVSGHIFNVGNSALNYTLSDVAEKIRQVFPQTQVELVENTDRRNYRVSFDKLRNRLRFRCRWSLEDGIAELKRAFDEGEVLDYREVWYDNQRFLQAAGSPAHSDEIDARIMAAFAAVRTTPGPTWARQPDRTWAVAS